MSEMRECQDIEEIKQTTSIERWFIDDDGKHRLFVAVFVPLKMPSIYIDGVSCSFVCDYKIHPSAKYKQEFVANTAPYPENG